jgi:hypothetical protein
MKAPKQIQLQWKEFTQYEEAKDCHNCLYAFVYEKEFLYIGRATKFGGPGARYANGYSYLIDALLGEGYRLYICESSDENAEHLTEIESQAIQKYKPTANKRIRKPRGTIHIVFNEPWS